MPEEPNERFPEGPSDEEIAARLRRVREELDQMEGLPDLPEDALPQLRPAPTLPDVPDFDGRLRDLEARAEAAKQKRHTKATAERRQMQREADSHRGLGIGLTLAYTLMGIPLAAIGIGHLVDQANDTNVYKGIGALIGSILGIVGMIFILNRHQSRIR